jgi:hypothetical protein
MRTLTASEMEAVAGGATVNTTRSNIKSSSVSISTGPGSITASITFTDTNSNTEGATAIAAGS